MAALRPSSIGLLIDQALIRYMRTSSIKARMRQTGMAVLASTAIMFTCSAASAQAIEGPKAAALQAVVTSCQDETARFCPGVDSDAIDPRDAFICLRVYKTSLSPACRRAVNGASR